MAATVANDPLLGKTTCGSLLQQLQIIWDEVGESDEERDKLLVQLEQECLDVYKRKVDQAAKSRSLLLQKLADSKAEYARLLSALGDNTVKVLPEKSSGTIKEQLAAIAPALKDLCKQKEKRVKELTNVQLQIESIRDEIAGISKVDEKDRVPLIDEDDLSFRKLENYQSQLQELQQEKGDRLHKVFEFVSTVHDLCAVLGMDFYSTITEVHPSLHDSIGQSKSISNETLSKLSKIVFMLTEDKKLRLLKLQGLAAQLTDLWNLMDTPAEERQLFNHITCNMSAEVNEISIPGALAIDIIDQAEAEVERLDQLKSSRMKEIAFKKQRELEDIHARAHVVMDTTAVRERIIALIDSGSFEPSELLADMDCQILKAKEEALSRRDILEKVEKWMSACEEESWLEDYSRDDNRYSSSRGAHLNLKRAEKARILVNKIPALVDSLVSKTRAWEEEKGEPFTYDAVPLLAMLDEYTHLRHDREEEKRRQRDQKRFQDQLATEQESLFGSRPSPARPLGSKKVLGPRANSNAANGSPSRRLSTPQSSFRSASRDGRRDSSRPSAPVNYVAISKDDVSSQVSSNNPIAASP